MKSVGRIFLILMGAMSAVAFGHRVFAGMSSTNYTISWDSLNGGGTDDSTSTNYSLYDTLGESVSGTSTSANYQLASGYRAIDAGPSLSFVLKSQDTSLATAFSSFNRSAKTITVASATGFNVGDYIIFIQGGGFQQKVGVGKITAVSGTTLALDALGGAVSSMDPSASGQVYRLADAISQFGAISPGTQNTLVTMSSVVSSVPLGYSVYVRADAPLQNGFGNAIADVQDGAVTMGMEEYGASATGTTAVNPDSDIAVTTTQRVIQTSAGISGAADRVVVTYKLSITAGTKPGTYTHNISYTLTANF